MAGKNGSDKNDNGRPPLYKTAKDLQLKVDEYFEHCEGKDLIPNIAGLCYFCDFTDRRSFTAQGERGTKFSDTCKRTKNRLYDIKFQKACIGKMDRSIFIFDSVNNHDMYNTRSESNNRHTGADGKGPVKHIIEFVDADDGKPATPE